MTTKQQHTILDRAVPLVLPPNNSSPVENNNNNKRKLHATDERLHRLHGTSLIQNVLCQIVPATTSVYATACTIFHRYMHTVSLYEQDVWSAAMGSCWLACKLEDFPLNSKQVILAFCHVYQRRRLVMLESPQVTTRVLEHKAVVADQVAATLLGSLDSKKSLLKSYPPILSKMGPTYKEWHEALIKAENKILRALGFVLYWIPDQHPHRFLIYFLRVLQVDPAFMQTCWSVCNDACRLDLCLYYEPYLIACAVIHVVAVQTESVSLAFCKINNNNYCKTWWQVFCGTGQDEKLANIANTLLALRDYENDPFELLIATEGMVRSLIPGGSFNDPDSFLWEVQSLDNRQPI